MAMSRLAAPRQGTGEFPAGGDFAGIQCARRQALLVDAGLELLGVDEMAPASLQRYFRRRVPRDPHGRRIEGSSLDVPAMLVGLAPVEPADFHFHPIEDDATGHNAEADVGRI